MPRPASFGWPFTPPNRIEAMALARAASYLLRTANEVETRRMTAFTSTNEFTPLADLPTLLQAAGHLCESIADSEFAEPGR